MNSEVANQLPFNTNVFRIGDEFLLSANSWQFTRSGIYGSALVIEAWADINFPAAYATSHNRHYNETWSQAGRLAKTRTCLAIDSQRETNTASRATSTNAIVTAILP